MYWIIVELFQIIACLVQLLLFPPLTRDIPLALAPGKRPPRSSPSNGGKTIMLLLYVSMHTYSLIVSGIYFLLSGNKVCLLSFLTKTYIYTVHFIYYIFKRYQLFSLKVHECYSSFLCPLIVISVSGLIQVVLCLCHSFFESASAKTFSWFTSAVLSIGKEDTGQLVRC